MGGGVSVTLFRKSQAKGPLYNPLGLWDSTTVPTTTTISSCVDRIRLALPKLPHQGSPKKQKPAALNCRLLFCGGGQTSPSDIRWPFTHRGTIVYLFNRFLILDADRVALDMCPAKIKQKRQKKKNDGHFKYVYLSKQPLFLFFYQGRRKRANDSTKDAFFFFLLLKQCGIELQLMLCVFIITGIL